MKQPCKHINEGSSCSLNNNCTYPECVKIPSAEEMWDEYSQYIDDDSDSFQRVAGTSVITKKDFEKACQTHTRLHLEALANGIIERTSARPSIEEVINFTLSDYLTKNKLEK